LHDLNGRLHLRHGHAGIGADELVAVAPEVGPSVPDDTQVLQVLDLAMRVGEVPAVLEAAMDELRLVCHPVGKHRDGWRLR